MCTSKKALAALAILYILTAFPGCGRDKISENSNERQLVSDESVSDYQTVISERENTYLKTRINDSGVLLYSIPFEVRTTDRKDFPDGIIPWVSIENSENDIAKLVDASKVIIPENEVVIVIGYPLKKEYRFNVESKNGFSKEQILRYISSAYLKIYGEEERSATIKTIPIENRGTSLNRNQTDGVYGIWGHDITDLVLGEALVYKSDDGMIILKLSIES